MAEDIVDDLRATAADAIAWEGETMKRWDNIRAMLMDGNTGDLPRLIFESIMDGHAEDMQEAAATIESLRAQLASEHALGFKAGIEAAGAIAQQCMDDEAAKIKTDQRGDMDTYGRRLIALGTANMISHEITSLPTPPSPLPEIMEAMRPVAREAESYGAAENAGKPFPDALKVGNGNITVGHLRTLAAMFTKLGGTHD